ncbi:Zinc finger BED domain containing protein 1 [Dissostichus eleginoides]|uniref:Zinc finger BED domain containing protein 1 n=1 Tax=Dissostichus eleginoides TaxID=100907 RepID=A0AAD9CKS5_DISEL|nr:Zinc finger BED domain containing protein 1 [Dissostichus eleginoides]
MGGFIKRPIQPLQQSKVDQALVKMIATDFQPFSIVEDRGFRAYTEALDPSYVLPSRGTISKRMLPNLFEKVRADIEEQIKTAPAVCLTTDCWTSNTTTSYMSVTCHYITDFKLRSNLLDCFVVTEQHTSQNLAQELSRVAKEWGIQDKIAACVTDNASNIVRAVNDILKWNHVRCFAHWLNLTVRYSVHQSEIQALILKVKSIAEYVCRSTVASAKLREMQLQMGQVQLRMKQDVATRWNSTYYMLQRVIEIKEPLVSTLALINPLLPALTPEEWDITKEVCDILKPFEEGTVEMSSESFVTGSKAILMARGLQRIVAHRQRNPSIHEPQIWRKDLSKLKGSECLLKLHFWTLASKSMPLSMKGTQRKLSRVVGAATHAAKPKLPSTEEEEEEEEEEGGTPVSPPSEPVPKFWADFEERVTTLRPGIKNPITEAMLEIKGFLAEPLIPRKADPLEWWRVRALVYHNVCTIMKTRLCIVATSVPSERVFSKTGQIITDRRNRLSPSKKRELVFLNPNL